MKPLGYKVGIHLKEKWMEEKTKHLFALFIKRSKFMIPRRLRCMGNII